MAMENEGGSRIHILVLHILIFMCWAQVRPGTGWMGLPFAEKRDIQK